MRVDRWERPRKICVVVDNPSWQIPMAKSLVAELQQGGDDARFCPSHDAITPGDVAFYLGCVRLTPANVLARNRNNLVVHASDLPQGKGFSPIKWQVLEGKRLIPITLFEAVEALDAGPIYHQSTLALQGHELLGEIQAQLAERSKELCLWFMSQPSPPIGRPQTGEASSYPRRNLESQRLDPTQSIASQFDALRVADNERFPAFFDHRGHRYRLHIETWDEDAS
jgi:methionyl-tRNA formyltransferase